MAQIDDAEELSFEQVVAGLRERTLLPVNVLPVEAFRQRRIRGSVNLPLQSIRTQAAWRLPDTSAELLVYCTGFG